MFSNKYIEVNMPRAFLSHSSKQKGFVEIVAQILGKDNVVLDIWTFEEGNRTLDEIYQKLNESDLFVLFISDEALESEWVKKEILIAYDLINKNKISRFLPLIIDENIHHDEKRIPEWIQRNYILKYVSKPTKVGERIRQSLRQISWDLFPNKKYLRKLFIGRTDQIKLFEEKIYDFNRPNQICMITTGLQSIGRRKFTLHCLIKSNKINEYDNPSTISLEFRNSIEDLITKLYDLGFSKKSKDLLLNLINKTIDEKVNITSELLLEYEKLEKILIIVDNYSIVTLEGNISEWFLKIIDKIKTVDRLFLCIISTRRVNPVQIRKLDYIFSIDLPELEKYERNALFKSLLDIHEIQINKNDIENICELFTGYPEQVFFAFNLIQDEGLPYLLNSLHLIADFASEKVTKVIKRYESDELAFMVLKFLSEFEFVSINLIYELFKDQDSKVASIIVDFTNNFIIDYIGATREYLRLNDAIKDFIQRLNIELDNNLIKKLELHIKSKFSFETDSLETDLDADLSDYTISVKELLKNNSEIPLKYLIPSHFVNAMRELYNYERRHNDVIKLADRVLKQERYMDINIIREIRYWLCLALARKRDKRFLTEVQKIDGSDHKYLLGIYYRLTRRYEEGIEILTEVLNEHQNFSRAKRELVQIYLNLDEYEKALTLAKESYLSDKNNLYNLQNYFRCLIKINDKKNIDIIENLLDSISHNPHDKAKEIYYTCKAQYLAFVQNNYTKACLLLDDTISMYTKNIYPHLTKLEICCRFNLTKELGQSIYKIETIFEKDSDIFSRLTYLWAKIIYNDRLGSIEEGKRILDEKIKNIFPKKTYDRILKECYRIK